MDLTNERYVIRLKTKHSSERYLKDREGWMKVSSKGRKFRMTAEQVLNHMLPVLAGIKQNTTLEVIHAEGSAGE